MKDKQKPDAGKTDLFRMGENPDAEQAFLGELGEAMFIVLASFAYSYNRIGVFGINYAAEQDHYNIGIHITDGLVSRLPCVPEKIRRESLKRYVAEMNAIKKEHGGEIEKWPEEAFARLVKDKFFVISVWPARIGKDSATFAMGIAIVLPDWQAAIRIPIERAFGLRAGVDDVDALIKDETRLTQMQELGFLQEWPREPEKLREKVFAYLNKWLLGPNCWETCRDRRIELYCGTFGRSLQASLMNWDMQTIAWPGKYWLCVFWCPCQQILDSLGDGKIREECASIIGTYFEPGKCAAFIMAFDLETPEKGMDATLHGPFPFDPIDDMLVSEVMKRAGEAILRESIPEADFDLNAEATDVGGDRRMALETNASTLARKVLERLGVRKA